MSDSTVYGKIFHTITPSDTETITSLYRGVIVGTSGNLVIVDKEGNQTVLPSLVAGIIHPIGEFTKIMSTGHGAGIVVGVR